MDTYEKSHRISLELKNIADQILSYYEPDNQKVIDLYMETSETELSKKLTTAQNRACVLNNIQNLLDARRELVCNIFRGCFNPDIRKAYDELDMAFMEAIKSEASNPDLFIEHRQSESLN